MAATLNSLSDLPLERLTLYHAVDPFLSSILVFHGSVTTANSTVSSSRIQAHIITPAGVQSYPRISISPAAPLYAAVNHLPREKQGDEIYRGLAVCLFKYFAELPEPVKNGLLMIVRSERHVMKLPKMFDEIHAADLANRMVKVDDPSQVIRDIRDGFRDRIVPWIDIDLILPPGSILNQPSPDSSEYDPEASETIANQYGKYSPLVQRLGDPIFIPTSKLRRAPSQPTNLSKSKVFSSSQKESLRLSMCEIVDTEERYVGKMYDLVHNVAEQFRQKAQDRPSSSSSPDETALAQLFPNCLNEILEVNLGFLQAIRLVLEKTEKEALSDISGDTTLDSSGSKRDSAGKRKDPMGAVAFANSLLEWFPRFSRPYAEYMRAHTGFSQLLNTFLHNGKSSFSRRVYETGEQKLRSMLMEPVQRLPRYSLLIDAMTNSLPSLHPAVRPLLKARDIITEICSLDSPGLSDHSQSLKRLQSIVAGWPTSILPSGRLITAVDCYELSPPYRFNSSGSPHEPGIMLLYQDYLILLSKAQSSKLSARGLYAELDSPPIVSGEETFSSHVEFGLSFSQAVQINNMRCSQSTCGRILYVTPAENFLHIEHPLSRHTFCALELASSYEGKAGRLIEEIIKARIEGRFSEQYRECGKWALRSPCDTYATLGILVAVFEEEPKSSVNRHKPPTAKIVFDTPKQIISKELNSSNIEAIASISILGGGRYKLDMESIVGISSTDTITDADFVSTISKRLNNLLRSLSLPQNPALTDVILRSNFDILSSAACHILTHSKVPRGFRPPSPSKLLSSLWGSGQSKENLTPSKSLKTIPVLGDIPKLLSSPSKVDPASPSLSGKNMNSTHSTLVGIHPPEKALDAIPLLEETLAAYVIAIRARSGNIVGRTLRVRENADPAVVNELYNTLLEDARKIQAAAEVSVDVLFVAFEMFISHAWKEQIGPIISPQGLRLLQAKFDTMFPCDFEKFFRHFLSEMSPQNRRALTGIVKLLADLLDASGNDGDRGVLTATFSGLLTEEGNALEHISLLDRFVEDFDRLFDEGTVKGEHPESSLFIDPANVPSRSHSVAKGSLSSNTSSFRKKFGFGTSREGSKLEGEGKVNSIIRNLSKSKGSVGSESQPSSISRGSLLRSRSTDMDSRLTSLLRPVSRDRLQIHKMFSTEEQCCRPGSAHSTTPTLASIGEAGIGDKANTRKKKRRSSLSDLKPFPGSNLASVLSSIEPRKHATPNSSLGRPLSSEIPSTANKMLLANGNGCQPPTLPSSPARSGSPSCHVTSNRKENVPPSTMTSLEKVDRLSDEVVNTQSSPKKGPEHGSHVSRAKGSGLRERTAMRNNSESPNRRVQPSSPPPKTQKLRMQSPQKLRERLQIEKKALAGADSTLQAEISLLGEEIASLRPSAIKGRPSSSGGAPNSSNSITSLLGRVRTLESKVATLSSNLGARIVALEKDVENSLLMNERRVRKLDELYRETTAENEALRERFKGDLSKVAKEAQLGSIENALRSQLKEALDEALLLKKENARQKREIISLKAQPTASAIRGKDLKAMNETRR